MKKIILFLILAVMGMNLFASSGFGFNTNSKVSADFSIPLDISCGDDYSYGLLGNETKEVWVETSPCNILMLSAGGASALGALILLPLGIMEDMDGMTWTAVGLGIGGVLCAGLSFCFSEGYYKTVEVVKNDIYESEIYLVSNIASTSIGYKIQF